MARRLISVDDFRKQLRNKRAGSDAVRAQTSGAVLKAADGSIDIVISTEAADRSKDVVKQDGWKLGNYQKNPIVLFAHDSSAPPVARCARLAIETNPGRLVARGVEFTPKDMFPFGGMIGEMVKGGFLNAASVGFLPLKYAFNDERGDWAIDFLEQELLEFSIVPVPANPEALVGAKAAGIDVAPLVEWAERVLDGDIAGTGVRRSQLEQVYRIAKGSVASVAPVVKDDDGDEDDKSAQCDCPDGALVKCEHCNGYVRMAQHDEPDGDEDDGDEKSLHLLIGKLMRRVSELEARLDKESPAPAEPKKAPAEDMKAIGDAFAAALTEQLNARVLGKVS